MKSNFKSLEMVSFLNQYLVYEQAIVFLGMYTIPKKIKNLYTQKFVENVHSIIFLRFICLLYMGTL